MEKLFIPSFLTVEVENTGSLYQASTLASDSDEISCYAYDCADSACTCNATYSPHCSCDSQCSDSCSSDSPCTDTPPSTGRITSVTSTATTITMRYTGIPGATSYEIAYRRTDVIGTAIYVSNGDRLSYTITGLDSETSYTVNYRGVSSSGNPGDFLESGVEIMTQKAFTPFDWTYAGLDLSRSPPAKVYGAAKKQGLGVYVTADEWNGLADLVETAAGASIPRVSPGDPISRAVVNGMAKALGVSTVGVNAPLSAAFFNDLRAAYNALG